MEIEMKKEIRETVKELLENCADLNTVRIGRRHNYAAAQLNAATIFTDTEETERISCAPVTLQNDVALVVRYFIKPTGYDLGEDTLDTIVAEADALILPAVADIDGVFDIEIQSLEIDGDGEADADYLRADRVYSVVYHTSEI